jgi:hypothetical protein
MSKKPTRADLEAEIERIRPYEQLAVMRHRETPIAKTQTYDYSSGKVEVTISYYGRGTSHGGVVEVVVWPLDDSGKRSDRSYPLVEVHPYLWISDAIAAFTTKAPTYGPPWGALIRWVITDGVRLANAADDARQAS